MKFLFSTQELQKYEHQHLKKKTQSDTKTLQYSEFCNNFVVDLHDGSTVSGSHTQLRDPWHSNRNTISQPMFRASPSTLSRLHRTVCPLALCWLLIQTASILQDYCNPETAGWALGAASVCRRLVLGAVTALTNEAGCMVEHHLRPANLISSSRRNGRILKDGGWNRLSWMDFPLRHWLLERIYLRA